MSRRYLNIQVNVSNTRNAFYISCISDSYYQSRPRLRLENSIKPHLWILSTVKSNWSNVFLQNQTIIHCSCVDMLSTKSVYFPREKTNKRVIYNILYHTKIFFFNFPIHRNMPCFQKLRSEHFFLVNQKSNPMALCYWLFTSLLCFESFIGEGSTASK